VGFLEGLPKSDAERQRVRHNRRSFLYDRFYTEHAVTRFLPSGRRTIAGFPLANKEGGGYAFDPKARSISPNYIEHAIKFGTKTFTTERGEARTIHIAGDLVVVTTRDNRIVITCLYSHEG
jgi:hypothetical protein